MLYMHIAALPHGSVQLPTFRLKHQRTFLGQRLCSKRVRHRPQGLNFSLRRQALPKHVGIRLLGGSLSLLYEPLPVRVLIWRVGRFRNLGCQCCPQKSAIISATDRDLADLWKTPSAHLMPRWQEPVRTTWSTASYVWGADSEESF